MKAMVVTKHGAPSVLLEKELPAPRPGRGEVLLAVKAAGVNFADVLARLGVYRAAPPPPFVPGIEVAGLVEDAGEGVRSLAAGDRVMAFCAFGGYAEKVVVREDAALRIPEDMTFSEAAAFPVQYLTAYYGLFHLGHMAEGESVLVHAAAGGVGTACMQLCRYGGARVFATVGSREKEAVVRRENPDARVIFYREEDFADKIGEATGGVGADLVMDSVGGWAFRKGWGLLAPGGRYILFGAASAVKPGAISRLAALWRLLPMLSVNPLTMIQGNRGLMGFNLYYLSGRFPLLREMGSRLLDLRFRGHLKPRVSLSLPLERAPEAHHRLQTRSTSGKIVLIL